MKKILVPTDFSEEANFALHYAIQISRKNGGEIILLHVIESPENQSFNEMGEMSHGHPENDLFIIQLMKVVKRRMNEIKEKNSELNIHDVVKVGHPFNHISKTITEQDVDLVVIGSKGASGITGLLVGSNAEKVVRYSNCPVVTVKGEVNIDDIKSIVFATDLSVQQYSVLERLKDFQEMLGAELKIVKINTHSDWLTDREVNNKAKTFIDSNNLDNYSFESYNADYIEDGIIQYTEDRDADMIALGTHGRSGITHLIAGSVAEDLVNHAKRPIWTMNFSNK